MYISTVAHRPVLLVLSRGKGIGCEERKGIRCRLVLHYHLTCSFKYLGVVSFLPQAMDMVQIDNITAGFGTLLQFTVRRTALASAVCSYCLLVEERKI
jgi:hypothetical protein